jgi:hypothetical protein
MFTLMLEVSKAVSGLKHRKLKTNEEVEEKLHAFEASVLYERERFIYPFP